MHAGYFYEPEKIHNKSSGGGISNYTYGNTLAQSVFLRLGLGKRYNFEKLYFISAINLPFQYVFYDQISNNVYHYDNFGQKLYSSFYTDKAAPAFNIGLSLQQSFYYKICKSFMAGMDLNMTLNCNVVNGTETSTSGSDYNGIITVTNKQTTKYKFETLTQLLFRPVVCIKYILPSKKNNMSPQT